MIVLKNEGLYCPEGDFFIDPLLPCKNAVITHAHADHARPGMKNYICTPETSEIMKLRISNDLLIKEVEYDKEIQINSVNITFIPAGHVLGSSQIKINNGSEVRRSKQLKNFIPYSTGFCSGWTLNSKRDFDKGFTISDHADWNDLIKTIEQTKAKKVIIVHGNGPMLRKYLNEKGITVSNFTKNKHEDSTFQLSLFNG